jgi:hypothetical protein
MNVIVIVVFFFWFFSVLVYWKICKLILPDSKILFLWVVIIIAIKNHTPNSLTFTFENEYFDILKITSILEAWQNIIIFYNREVHFESLKSGGSQTFLYRDSRPFSKYFQIFATLDYYKLQ